MQGAPLMIPNPNVDRGLFDEFIAQSPCEIESPLNAFNAKDPFDSIVSLLRAFHLTGLMRRLHCFIYQPAVYMKTWKLEKFQFFYYVKEKNACQLRKNYSNIKILRLEGEDHCVAIFQTQYFKKESKVIEKKHKSKIKWL